MENQIDYRPLAGLDDTAFDGKFIKIKKFPEALNITPLRFYSLIFAWIILSIVLIVFLHTFGLYLAGLIAAYPFYRIYRNYQSQLDISWRNFARANSYKLIPADEAETLVPQSIITSGHSHKTSEAVNGELFGTEGWIVEHRFTIGYGRGAETYDATIVGLKINASLPHMLIRSPKALISGNHAELKEQLQLEGDFSKQFKVFATEDREIDELEILTPDLMQFLMENSRFYNIETDLDRIYIVSDNDLRRADKLPIFINFCESLYREVLENLPLASSVNRPPSAT